MTDNDKRAEFRFHLRELIESVGKNPHLKAYYDITRTAIDLFDKLFCTRDELVKDTKEKIVEKLAIMVAEFSAVVINISEIDKMGLAGRLNIKADKASDAFREYMTELLITAMREHGNNIITGIAINMLEDMLYHFGVNEDGKKPALSHEVERHEASLRDKVWKLNSTNADNFNFQQLASRMSEIFSATPSLMRSLEFFEGAQYLLPVGEITFSPYGRPIPSPTDIDIAVQLKSTVTYLTMLGLSTLRMDIDIGDRRYNDTPPL